MASSFHVELHLDLQDVSLSIVVERVDEGGGRILQVESFAEGVFHFRIAVQGSSYPSFLSTLGEMADLKQKLPLVDMSTTDTVADQEVIGNLTVRL